MLAFGIAGTACIHQHLHFAPIAALAYVHAGGCSESTRVDVEPLSDRGFRTGGCGDGEAYYRCWLRGKTRSQQCCERVADEAAATATFFAHGNKQECIDVE